MGLVLLLVFGAALNVTFSETDFESFSYVDLRNVREGVDFSYRGKLARRDQVRNLLDQLPRKRAEAIRYAEWKIGLPFHRSDRLVVTIRDSLAMKGFGASSKMVRSDIGEVHLVSLSAEQVVLGVMDVDACLVHESIHCLMRDLMGDRPYRALPRWIREGIAVWGAGQLEERANEVVARAFLDKRDPLAVLDKIGDFESPVDYYLVVALAFEYVCHNHGEEAVREIIADIVDGRKPDRAFEDATGLPMPIIEKRRRGFARLYFEHALVDSGLLEFQEAQRLHALGYTGRAIEVLMAMSVYRPDALLHANAWYTMGEWCYEQGRYPQAALAFNVVIDNFPKHVGLRADSRDWLRKCYRRMSGDDIYLVQTVLAGY